MKIIVRVPTIEDELEIRKVVESSLKDLHEVYRPKPEAIAHSCNLLADRHRIIALINGQIVGTTEYVLKSPCVHVIGIGVLPDTGGVRSHGGPPLRRTMGPRNR